jgi:hypothetical protein
MASEIFGIYILTYPGDFHLSTILVRSIQQVSPDLPVMIIPGEGFDLNDHPFDVPVMPLPIGFWAEIGHQDRDFWAFQGPFETFLYLDADTIVVKSLDDLAKRIARQEGDFIYTQSWVDDEKWRSVIQNPEHPDHNTYRQIIADDVGRGPLAEFDPDHDFFSHKTFNSGVFASRRFAIKESDLASLNEAERKFYREVLGKDEWTWKSSELFFCDQGRLNYLVHKLSIPVFPLAPELIWVSGADSVNVSFEDVKNNTSDFNLIHWMGAKSPTPSYFCTKPLFTLYAHLWSYVGRRTGRYVAPGYEQLSECTGYSLWRHYYECSYGPFPLRERLQWSWRDLKRVYKLTVRSLRLLTRSIISRG